MKYSLAQLDSGNVRIHRLVQSQARRHQATLGGSHNRTVRRLGFLGVSALPKDKQAWVDATEAERGESLVATIVSHTTLGGGTWIPQRTV